MKLWKKNTQMSSLLNHNFKHGNLISKIFLLAEIHAMQQLSFLKGQTGLHFAQRFHTLNLGSSKVCRSPFGSLDSVIIFCILLWNSGNRLDCGMTVSFWCRWEPPLDLFMLKALSVLGGNKAWADDWSKIKRAWQPGCAVSKVGNALVFICSMSCLQSHQGSPFELPEYMICCASFTIFQSRPLVTNWPSSGSIKSETCIKQPQSFFGMICSVGCSLYKTIIHKSSLE